MPRIAPPPSRLLIQEETGNSREWLKWFQGIEEAFSKIPEPPPPIKIIGLQGSVDDFTLDSTDSKLVNYSLGTTSPYLEDVGYNQATGEITIPEDGYWQLVIHIFGQQGNNTKDDEIDLKIDRNGTKTVVASREVATNKTTNRSVGAVVTRQLSEGDVISIYMWASSNLGTFNNINTTFELHKIL